METSTDRVRSVERITPWNVREEEWGKVRYRATLALRDISPRSQPPYFSATFTSEERRGSRWYENGGGAGHDTILELWPEFAPVVAVHLSDWNGVPMHAEENARYWLGLTEWEPYNRDVLCRHLRVTPQEADEIHAYVAGPAGEHSDREALKYMFKMLHLRERWHQEARDALAIIQVGDPA